MGSGDIEVVVKASTPNHINTCQIMNMSHILLKLGEHIPYPK